jgi:hypothetical protein
MDAGHRTVVHGFLDLFLRGSGRIMDAGLAVRLHLENLGADVGADFTGDAGFFVDDGDAGHGLGSFSIKKWLNIISLRMPWLLRF